MVTRSSHRVTVRQGEAEKNLVSIGSNPSGDVFLSLRTVSHSMEPEPAPYIPKEEDELIEERITIHPARAEIGSNKYTSTINYHLFKKGDLKKEKPKRQLSEALVDKAGFNILFVRLCPLLGGPKSQIGLSRAQNLSIGSYDPELLTLVFGLFVGHRDLCFRAPNVSNGNFSIDQFVFKNLRFVIVKSYITMPSTVCGLRYSGIRLAQEDVPQEIKDRIVKGLNENECIFLFRMIRSKIFDTYRAFRRKESNHDPFVVRMLDLTSFLGSSDLEGPDYSMHIARISPFIPLLDRLFEENIE